MSRILDVYLHDYLAGFLRQDKSGKLSFSYHLDYLSANKLAISLSLPLQEKIFVGAQVSAFFSSLLPEGEVRMKLAKYLGLSDRNSFALLGAVGGDCAGAISLYPHGASVMPISNEVEILDDAKLKEILELIKRRPMLIGDDGCRLSLAGAQDKLAVGFRSGKVLLMKGGAPTTHILKPVISGIKDSAHNELFSMRLAKMLSLNVAEASLHYVGDTPYYLVARYDRQVGDNGSILRCHQEDFCQALGVHPELKYENEGGPSITDCQNIISKYTRNPARDQLKFLQLIIFNYLLGNNDAHGKNFSLLYRDMKPDLAPAYDLISTAIYPGLAQKMAMKIGRKYKADEVLHRHFCQLVADNKLAKEHLNKILVNMSKDMQDAASALVEEMKSQGLYSPILGDIVNIIHKRGKRLKEFVAFYRSQAGA